MYKSIFLIIIVLFIAFTSSIITKKLYHNPLVDKISGNYNKAVSAIKNTLHIKDEKANNHDEPGINNKIDYLVSPNTPIDNATSRLILGETMGAKDKLLTQSKPDSNVNIADMQGSGQSTLLLYYIQNIRMKALIGDDYGVLLNSLIKSLQNEPSLFFMISIIHQNSTQIPTKKDLLEMFSSISGKIRFNICYNKKGKSSWQSSALAYAKCNIAKYFIISKKSNTLFKSNIVNHIKENLEKGLYDDALKDLNDLNLNSSSIKNITENLQKVVLLNRMLFIIEDYAIHHYSLPKKL